VRKWLPLLAIIAFGIYLLATDHAAAEQWLRLLRGNR
jgi:hypothetical protein